MTSQVTIRAKVIEEIKDGIGYPTGVRVTGCGNFGRSFISEVAQEAVDAYYEYHGFETHRYAPDIYSYEDIQSPDDFVVPVEYIPTPDHIGSD